tara:strand:- start:477 stop:989 length:513 start_codon:yes stop_codon:yes gene_type:complete
MKSLNFAKISQNLSENAGLIVLLLILIVMICLWVSVARKESNDANNKKEDFSTIGLGPVHPQPLTQQTSVQMGIPHSQCTPENDCYPGNYLRTENYQNLCAPKYGALNREPIQLADDCLRNLGKAAQLPFSLHCTVDQHLNRHCTWTDNQPNQVNQVNQLNQPNQVNQIQ